MSEKYLWSMFLPLFKFTKSLVWAKEPSPHFINSTMGIRGLGSRNMNSEMPKKWDMFPNSPHLEPDVPTICKRETCKKHKNLSENKNNVQTPSVELKTPIVRFCFEI